MLIRGVASEQTGRDEKFALHERSTLVLPGFDSFRLTYLTRLVSQAGFGGFIAYSSFQAEDVDEAIRTEIAFFSRLGRTFEWQIYDGDLPIGIADNLLQYGF